MSDLEFGRRVGVLAWTLLRLALAAYVLWLVGACFVQRRILFPTFAVRAPSAGGFDLPGMERHWLETSDGRVEWWFFVHPEASAEEPAPLLVFAHGNGELIDFQRDEVESYRELGFHVLLCEYRGYGRSEGSPSEAGILEDHRRVLDLVLAREDVDASRLLYHGRSLGTGVVCGLIEHRAPAGLILSSPFTSVADIMKGYWVPEVLVFDPFDNEEALRENELPVMIFHGERDRTVPFAHGERLAKLREGIELVSFPEASHNDMPMEGEVVWERIEAFGRRVGVL